MIRPIFPEVFIIVAAAFLIWAPARAIALESGEAGLMSGATAGEGIDSKWRHSGGWHNDVSSRSAQIAQAQGPLNGSPLSPVSQGEESGAASWRQRPGVSPGRRRLRVQEVRVFPLFPIEAALIEDLPAPAGEVWFDQPTMLHYIGVLRRRMDRAGQPVVRALTLETLETTDTVSVSFLLEGPDPVFLSKMYFDGGGYFASRRFRKKLAALEPDPIDVGTTLTAARVARVWDLAGAFWREEGYPDVAPRLDEITFNRKGDRAKLRFSIERGEKYRIERAVVEGVTRFDPRPLQRMADDLIGRDLTQSRLDALRDHLEIYYRMRGYMGVTADVRHGLNRETRAAAVVASIDEGTTSVLGAVYIRHREMADPPRDPDSFFQRFRRYIAPRISDQVIADMVLVESGMDLNERRLTQLRRRLMEMRTFDAIDVHTVATTETHVRDLVVDVRDQRTARADVMLGYADQTGPMAGGQIVENNVGGRGDRAALTALAGAERNNVSLSYLDRHWETGEWLFGRRRATSLQYSVRLRQADYDEYDEMMLGGSLEMERNVGAPGTLWRQGVRLRFDHVSHDPEKKRSAYEEDFGDYQVATVRYQIAYDSRDHPTLARDGFKLVSGLEGGYARSGYVKWLTNAENYVPLFRDWTWASLGEFGLIPHSIDGVGLSERLHGGGTYDFRGFDPRGMGPVDRLERSLHTGGATKLLFQNELRYDFGFGLTGVGFVDTGVVDEDPFGLRDWRVTVGPGLRFAFPDSPNELFLYVGQAVVKKRDDDTRSAHFGISFLF